MKARRADESPPKAASAADEAEARGAFSVGQYLKSQRMLRDIDIEELSLRTRIPRRSIERLEAGAFDGEPDGFVRGFVRTVAEGLGLDPEDTLMRMLSEPETGGRRAGLGMPPRVWVALAGVVVVLLAVLGLTQLAMTGASDLEVDSGDEVVTRRDPVRALAEAQAASPPLSRLAPPATAGPAEGVEGDEASELPVEMGTEAARAEVAGLPAVSSLSPPR